MDVKTVSKDLTIIEAVDNAIELLEALGYVGGDIVDDLRIVAHKLRRGKNQLFATEELGK